MNPTFYTEQTLINMIFSTGEFHHTIKVKIIL